MLFDFCMKSVYIYGDIECGCKQVLSIYGCYILFCIFGFCVIDFVSVVDECGILYGGVVFIGSFDDDDDDDGNVLDNEDGFIWIGGGVVFIEIFSFVGLLKVGVWGLVVIGVVVGMMVQVVIFRDIWC